MEWDGPGVSGFMSTFIEVSLFCVVTVHSLTDEVYHREFVLRWYSVEDWRGGEWPRASAFLCSFIDGSLFLRCYPAWVNRCGLPAWVCFAVTFRRRLPRRRMTRASGFLSSFIGRSLFLRCYQALLNGWGLLVWVIFALFFCRRLVRRRSMTPELLLSSVVLSAWVCFVLFLCVIERVVTTGVYVYIHTMRDDKAFWCLWSQNEPRY